MNARFSETRVDRLLATSGSNPLSYFGLDDVFVIGEGTIHVESRYSATVLGRVGFRGIYPDKVLGDSFAARGGGAASASRDAGPPPS